MPVPWPDGFVRVPDEPWARTPIRDLAAKYDTLEQHGWYRNLDPTVEEVAAYVRGRLEAGSTGQGEAQESPILVDYSGGTGIFIEWFLLEVGDLPVGLVNVDSSPKFLRLSAEKFRDEPRVALRRIRYLEEEGRLELLDEVLGPLADRGVDGLVSTNAIHLYHDLDDTLAAWRRVLRPGARCLVQSGNIRREGMPDGRWIIDETVGAVAKAAEAIVREAGGAGRAGGGGGAGRDRDDRWSAHRDVLEDADRMEAHAAFRRKVFVPVRPLDHYVDALEGAGFEVERVAHRPVPVRVPEWVEFLSVYHAAVLGWVGGTERVDGKAPTEEAVEDRKALLAEAVDRVFDGAETFTAEWTYLTCARPG